MCRSICWFVSVFEKDEILFLDEVDFGLLMSFRTLRLSGSVTYRDTLNQDYSFKAFVRETTASLNSLMLLSILDHLIIHASDAASHHCNNHDRIGHQAADFRRKRIMVHSKDREYFCSVCSRVYECQKLFFEFLNYNLCFL